jgi:hypothetical protein
MGYILEAKININYHEAFVNFIEQLTKHQAALIENFSSKFIIYIPKDCVTSLSLIFDRLEKGQSKIFRRIFFTQKF